MPIAPTLAIIEVTPIVPTVPVARDPEPATRQRAKDWRAPRTIGRGQLIDLVV